MSVKIPWHPLRIPAYQPRQTHLSEGEDQWLGDSRQAPKKAGKGGKTDTNVRPLLDQGGGAEDIAAEHAPTPRAGGWHFKVVSRNRLGIEKRVPLEREELDTPFEKIPRAHYKNLRRTKRRGISFASRCAPLTLGESFRFHKKYGAIPVTELKHLIDAARLRKAIEYAHSIQLTVWGKTLVWQSAHAPKPPYSMKAAAAKAAEAQKAGYPIALATHGFPVPHDLEQYRHLFDAIWGSNASRYRPKESK